MIVSLTMAYMKLNHKIVKIKMNKKNIRSTDLANKLGISRQLMHYILHIGGVKYAKKLSIHLGCKEKDLLIRNVITK
jgi:DNA-binding Xre family transcriptional regulator